MQKQNLTSYSDKMIEAFIGKPEVTLWYQNAFSRYNVNGVDTVAWNWSWWAFGTGFLYLLYRKQYSPALVLFVISSLVGVGSFLATIIVMILSGGFCSYFVYKGYKQKLLEIETAIDDENTRIETMRLVGGYNAWVPWVYALLMFLLFFGLFRL